VHIVKLGLLTGDNDKTSNSNPLGPYSKTLNAKQLWT